MRWLLAAAAVIAVVVAGVWALGRPSQREVGGNRIGPGSFVLDLKGGHRVCDEAGGSYHDSDYVRAVIGLDPGAPPQPLQLSLNGRRGPVLRSYRGGVVKLPIAGPPPRLGAYACLYNRGDHKVAVAGTEGTPPASVDGKPRAIRISFVFVARHRPSWNARRADAWRRIDHAVGAPLGVLTGALVLVLFAGAVLGSAAAIGRWAR